MQPRVPVAGVKRRWGGRPSSGAPGSLQLQDSSTEVTSSGVLSLSLQQPPPPPPSHYETAASESAADTPTPEAADQTSQLWNLDLPMRTSSCTASSSSVVHISTSSNSINSSTNNSQQRSNLKMVASINTTSGLLMPSLTHQETSSLSSVACPSGIIEGTDPIFSI
ncbi:uncharacterized protein LOC106646712 [Copidosoma floridanum]|uniref:uncharacterized protein LOC106646712 n=1 Tax=Copidosoma floridanum TaxID=29053 RepID=UPI0006C9C3C3|nr:uncharacterized protein LOC106646712 [Copidosoma floridanum]